jgi:hypothetical protein
MKCSISGTRLSQGWNIGSGSMSEKIALAAAVHPAAAGPSRFRSIAATYELKFFARGTPPFHEWNKGTVIVATALCRREREAPGRSEAATKFVRLFQYRLMKFVPVVEIVQVHRILRRRGVVRQAAIAQDRFPRLIVMIISAHGRVMFFDFLGI